MEWFVPKGRVRMQSLQWQLNSHWCLAKDDPVTLVPMVLECFQCVKWWQQEEKWAVRVPFQMTPPSLPVQRCLEDRVGDSSGGVDRGRTPSPYQHLGDEIGSAGLDCLPGPDHERIHCPDSLQCHIGGILKQRDTVY